ncbi:MAG: hypothetical protein HY611_00725 [Elusimicrobia bacterium]|nr:hypothetical protein [Elusimicrobiota bacterium]
MSRKAKKASRARWPIRILDKKEDDRETLRYWLSQTPEARISAVEVLREQMYKVKGKNKLPRLVRVVRLRELHEGK